MSVVGKMSFSVYSALNASCKSISRIPSSCWVAIATQQEEGIREMDLQLAFNAEYTENDIFPTTDITEDWLKLIDYDPENVVKIAPRFAFSVSAFIRDKSGTWPTGSRP